MLDRNDLYDLSKKMWRCMCATGIRYDLYENVSRRSTIQRSFGERVDGDTWVWMTGCRANRRWADDDFDRSTDDDSQREYDLELYNSKL